MEYNDVEELQRAGHYIKYLLKTKGYTLQSLGAELDVSRQRIFEIVSLRGEIAKLKARKKPSRYSPQRELIANKLGFESWQAVVEKALEN